MAPMTPPNPARTSASFRRVGTTTARWSRRSATAATVAALTVVLLPATSSSAEPVAVELGTASQFSVLAGSAVTNTGPTVIKADAGVGGNLGVSPGLAVTGFPPGIVTPPGVQHAGDAVAGQAQSDLTTAYNQAAASPCDQDLSGQDLGGLTLTTGTYCFDTSAQLTGALTLDAARKPDAVFIFRIGSTLTTASASAVLDTRGAQACNVFWQVGSSATLGTDTAFAGNILALQSVTGTTGADVEGRLLAANGAVTLDSNTVTTSACAPKTGVAQAPLFGHLSSLMTFLALAGAIAVYLVLRRRRGTVVAVA